MPPFWRHLEAASIWGPGLCALGILFLAAGVGAHGWGARPSILPVTAGGRTAGAPSFWERASLHLVIYPVWAIGFGAIVWRGVPHGAIDVRCAAERHWPVFQQAEWVYLSSYLVPFAVPWLANNREALRRYALDLWWLLLVCGLCFLVLPLDAPPRRFTPDSLIGRMLAWETARADFASAAWPSFHVCWALLCARFFGTLRGAWPSVGRAWAIAVAVSCLATGAHALADVAASVVVYPLVVSERLPLRALLRQAEARWFKPSPVFADPARARQ